MSYPHRSRATRPIAYTGLQLPTLIAHTATKSKASTSATPDENNSPWPRRWTRRPRLLRSCETICGVVSQLLQNIVITRGSGFTSRFSAVPKKRAARRPDVLDKHNSMVLVCPVVYADLVTITLHANGK
jgi:hypothetical protein